MNIAGKRELFSQQVTAGIRTYFLTLTRHRTKYLVITESQLTGSLHVQNPVTVFEEHLKAFSQRFLQTLRFGGIKTKTYSLKRLRRRCPRAYERWTSDEDEMLKIRYQDGAGIRKLATYL